MITLLLFALCDFGPCPHLYITVECYLQTKDVNQHKYQADINKDGEVNLIDFAIYAKEFPGGKYKPKPEPEPNPEPAEIPIEIKALILKLLMDE